MSSIAIAGASGLTVGTTTITGGTNGRVLFDNSGVLGEVTHLTTDGTNVTLERIASGTSLDWDNGSGTVDLSLFRDGSGILALRNGTNPQTLRVYNTFTDSSNYERAIFDFNTDSNVLTIGTEKAGTGSEREIRFIAGGTLIADFGISAASAWTFRGNSFTFNGTFFANITSGVTFATNASGADFGHIGVSASQTWFLGHGPTITNVATQVLQWTGLNSVIINGSVATNATDGFLYIPTCAGTPTGTPTTQTGTVAMVYDTTNNKFYIYNGAWKGGTNPGVFT